MGQTEGRVESSPCLERGLLQGTAGALPCNRSAASHGQKLGGSLTEAARNRSWTGRKPFRLRNLIRANMPTKQGAPQAAPAQALDRQPPDQMVLSTADGDALEAWLRSTRGTQTLREFVLGKLLAFFKANSIAKRELDRPPPGSSEEKESLVQEWQEYARDAGLVNTSDVGNVGRWIAQTDSGRAVSGGRSGRAAAVADALARKGVTLDRGQELAVGAAILAADQGEADAQCRCVEVIWLIYTGQLPGVEEREWFAEKRGAAVMAKPGEDPKVDIRLCKTYAKQHATTSVTTLERALLDKSGLKWDRYYSDLIEQMNQCGFAHAALFFEKVVSFSRKQHLYDKAAQLQYLHSYFFSYHLGRGLPEEVCTQAALLLTSSSVAQSTHRSLEMRPTVPEDASVSADALGSQMALMGGMGGLMGGPPLGGVPGGPPGSAQAGQPMPFGAPMGFGVPGAATSADAQMRAAMQAGAQFPDPRGQQAAMLQWQMMQQQQMQQAQQQMQQMQLLGWPMTAMGAQFGAPGPSDAGPKIEDVTQEPCVFCGKKTHTTEKCSFMLKYRKTHRETQAAAAAAKKDE